MIPLKYILLIIAITIVLIVDLFRLKQIRLIKDNLLVFIVKIFLVIFEFLSVSFGLNVINCISALNENICNSGELNALIFGIGIAFIIFGAFGYLFTLITLNWEDLRKA